MQVVCALLRLYGKPGWDSLNDVRSHKAGKSIAQLRMHSTYTC